MERLGLGEMASTHIMVERGVVGFGLDYACTHIIIPASENLLPILADFMTERDIYMWHVYTIFMTNSHNY